MCEALRELFADELMQREVKGKTEGKAEGKAEGETKGTTLKLLSLVRKKMARGLNAIEIAEVLEESDTALVKKMYDFIQANPKYTDDAIYELL